VYPGTFIALLLASEIYLEVDNHDLKTAIFKSLK
jgi:hypothetical protein